MMTSPCPVFPDCGPGRYEMIIGLDGLVEASFLGPHAPANDAGPALRLVPPVPARGAVDVALRPFLDALADLLCVDLTRNPKL